MTPRRRYGAFFLINEGNTMIHTSPLSLANIPQDANRSPLVILGAGLAGLACACRLSDLGFKNIVLIEKESVVGGLATSIHYKGHTSDLGPHRIHTEVPAVHEFLQRWEGDLLITCRRRSRMFLRGKWIPYPPGLFNTFLQLGPLPVIRYSVSYIGTKILYARGSRIEETYESLMEKAFGRALYRAIIKPYTEKTWGMNARELSPDAARARVSAGGFASLARRLFLKEQKGEETSLTDFLYISGGIGNLALHLQKTLEQQGVRFLLQSEVTGLTWMGNDGGLVHFIKDKTPQTLRADFCFSTIPIPELIGFLQENHPDAEVRQAAGLLEYLSMLLVFVRMKKDRVSDDTWLYFPERGVLFNRGYESRNFDASLGPDGESLLCLEITCRRGDKMWECPEEEIKTRVCREISRIGLVRQEEILDAHLVRLTHAYPVYDLLYRRKLQTIWSYLTQYPRLMTLGRQGLFHHNNMDHSIYEGCIAGDYYATKKEAASDWYRDEGQFRKLRIVD